MKSKNVTLKEIRKLAKNVWPDSKVLETNLGDQNMGNWFVVCVDSNLSMIRVYNENKQIARRMVKAALVLK